MSPGQEGQRAALDCPRRLARRGRDPRRGDPPGAIARPHLRRRAGLRRGAPAVNADIRVSEDPARAAAEILAGASGHVAITGGSTPRAAYERVASMREEWSGVDVWFTDE